MCPFGAINLSLGARISPKISQFGEVSENLHSHLPRLGFALCPTGTFEFRAHWRPTEISVPIATEYCNHTSVKLTVTNERGKSAYATLECN